MKTKKLLSLLLAVLLVVGLIPAAVLTVSADGVSTAYDYYYYENFEGFSTDMTGEQIKTALGWSSWDLDVAGLKIVETVYFREAQNGITGFDATALNSAGVMTTGEWTIRNHRTVDIAKLKNVSGFESLDYANMKTYTKRLLVIPQAGNQTISQTLVSNLSLGGGLFLDYELIPDYWNTLEVTNGAAVARSYESDSSLGLTVSDDAGNSVSGALQANASMRYDVVKNSVATTSPVTTAQWYTTILGGSTIYGTLNLDQTESTYRTYSDGKSGSLFYATTGTNTANGLDFAYRMKITDSDFSAFITHKVQNSANYWVTNWKSTSDSRSAEFESAADGLFNSESNLSVSLKYHHSGISFYLDNIIVANHNGNAGAPVSITVDGAARKVVNGVTVSVNDFTPAGKQLLYAEVNDAIKYADDTVALAEGTTITTHAVDISMVSGAQTRLNDPSGLRWQTKLNQADLDALAADANLSNLTIGTVILPKSYYDTLESLSFANLEAIEVVSGAKYLNVDATVGQWFATDGENYIFAGSLAQIQKSHYETDFIGVGYLTAEIGGRTVELFAAPAEARSVKFVASAALADVSATQEGSYQYPVSKYLSGGEVVNSTAYSPYTEEQCGILWDFFGA